VSGERAQKANVLPLFEAMTSALLFAKPDRPKDFLKEKLMTIRSGEAQVREKTSFSTPHTPDT
jgi:hypothetical protein